jgi:hypothetical protein
LVGAALFKLMSSLVPSTGSMRRGLAPSRGRGVGPDRWVALTCKCASQTNKRIDCRQRAELGVQHDHWVLGGPGAAFNLN